MKNIILRYALKNALDFGGKINDRFVLGQVLRERPELKEKVPRVLDEIKKVAKEISRMKKGEWEKKLKEIAPEMPPEKKEKTIVGPLKPLPQAQQGKVVVRIAPSPSGPLHIGHAYGLSLNYEYARMYDGKFILRIEDTNPENIYPPAYEQIEQDTRWLAGNQVSQVIVQSSRLGIYYDYAEKLIQKGQAYVCTCDPDRWREKKNQGEACSCRGLDKKENLQRYAQMFSGYAEGEAVLRFKTEIKHQNPAMRDFAIMRIVEHVHPKTKKEQRVWPLMLFAVAVDDHELGITHVLNGKDHADNAQKEQLIMKNLGWKPPEYRHWGRINFLGFELSTSKTRKAIEEGKYTGWDDIRLPFLPALRRRGYQPEAFRKFALEIGLSLTDKTVMPEEFWKMINAFNKETIDPKANRYFFIDDPREVQIKDAPVKEVEIDKHPDFPQRGKRRFKVNGQFIISQSDWVKLQEGKTHRLMDCLNFKIKKGKPVYFSDKYEDYKNSPEKGMILHWLPGNGNLKVYVLLTDGKVVNGWGEKDMSALKEGDLVQLERRYFARADKVQKDKVTFWYLHK